MREQYDLDIDELGELDSLSIFVHVALYLYVESCEATEMYGKTVVCKMSTRFGVLK